jgi:hypothetical protein
MEEGYASETSGEFLDGADKLLLPLLNGAMCTQTLHIKSAVICGKQDWWVV